MVAVFFPVMLCQLIERSVSFLVLAAVKLALELVWLVVLIHVRQEIIVVHLFFAFANFRTCCSLALELSVTQVLFGLYNLVCIFVCVFEIHGAGHASLFVIFVEDGSAGAANWIETICAVPCFKYHVHARTAYDQILVFYQGVLERKRNLRL